MSYSIVINNIEINPMQFFYKNKNILPLLDVLQHPLFYRQKRLEILVYLCAMIFSFFKLSKFSTFTIIYAHLFFIRLRFYFGSILAKNHISFKELMSNIRIIL